MTPLIRHLASYAAYHRDHRNVLTHMIGIPLIAFAVEVLASRPVVAIGAMVMTPAILLSALAAIFYLRLDLRFGLVMTVLLALGAWAGLVVAATGRGAYLSVGVGAFAVGWAIQFLGHYYEGRKPAFLDDIRGLIIGPLFVVAEIGFLIGARPEIRTAIDRGQFPASS
ncbi:Mpo1 family 2-hydroxy fatty acid dioxygenase [Sphingomonas oryzagri]